MEGKRDSSRKRRSEWIEDGGVEWSGSSGFGGGVEWAGDRWRPDQLSRSVLSLGLWVTRSMVQSKGSSDCEGVVGCRSMTCS